MTVSGWRTFLRRLVRKIWFRLALFATVALALALVARLIGPLLPDSFAPELGQGSVRTLLQILASSMLVVTTFSLTAMVSAYASAAVLGTPRATQLPFVSQVDEFTAEPSNPHVHVEVIDPSIPDIPTPGGGC